jgi:uncharacterized delta-60 repeat protein
MSRNESAPAPRFKKLRAHAAHSLRGPRLPVFEPLEDRQLLAGGLDGTFNASGTRTVAFDLGGPNRDDAADVAIDSQGRVVVVGTVDVGGGDTDFAVARFNADGTIDTTFNGTGKRTIALNLGGTNRDAANAVAIDSQGRIVIVGSAQRNAPGEAEDLDFAIVRLTSTGALDASFNGTGKLIIPFNIGSGLRDIANDVAIEAGTDKVLVVGVAQFNSAGDSDYAVAKLMADGTLDTTFNTTGKRTVAFDLGGTNYDEARSVAIDSNGRIVIAGFSSTSNGGNTDFTAARLTSTGALDSTFGGGKRSFSFELGGSKIDKANSVAIDPVDGAIYLGGFVQVTDQDYDFGIVKLRPSDGSLDTEFNSTGRRTVAFNLGGGNGDFGQAVAVDPVSRRVVVAGTVTRNGAGDLDFGVARLTRTGELDSSFGAGGKQLLVYNNGQTFADTLSGLAIDSNARIVVVGTSETPAAGSADWVVTRLVGVDAAAPTSVYSLATTGLVVSESAGQASIVITRAGDLSRSELVTYVIGPSPGAWPTAVLGVDYTGSTGQVAFAPGQSQAVIVVPIINDSTPEAAQKAFTVQIQAPSGSSVGSASAAVVIIQDDDAARVVAVKPIRARGAVTAIRVDFSDPLDAASVAAASAFQLYRGRRVPRQGVVYNRAVRVQAVYNAGDTTVFLKIPAGWRTREVVRLVISPTVRTQNQVGMGTLQLMVQT